MKKRWDEPYLKKTKYNDRIRLKTGTFLHTYCPHCGKSLIEDNKIVLTAVNMEGEEGRLELSPYLNIFEHRSTINIPPKMELKDLKCPHCKESLVHPEVRCGYCDSKTAQLMVAVVQKRVPFLICLRKGCKWHGITPEDEEILIRDSSDEW
ncbi:MAG: hypothetical protein DRG27_04325 [Deltaproteobacteria bacterium]|nr:MAG: hypothetical protein DRG27_04325 [Deltaproteobacteria bacterium]